MDRAVQIVAVAGSNRKRSLNRLLLRRAVEALQEQPDVVVDVVDLREHPLPLYDADLHAAEGMAAEALALHDRSRQPTPSCSRTPSTTAATRRCGRT